MAAARGFNLHVTVIETIRTRRPGRFDPLPRLSVNLSVLGNVLSRVFAVTTKISWPSEHDLSEITWMNDLISDC